MSMVEYRDYAEEHRARLLLKLYPERPQPKPKTKRPVDVPKLLRGETRTVDVVPRGRARHAADPAAVTEFVTAYLRGDGKGSAGVLRGIPVVGGAAGVQPGTQPELAQTDAWCDCGRRKQPWRRVCDPCHNAGR